ncbi:MAG: hypothetical protein AB7S74_19155, partial [Hyphomicrobium sp.]
MQQEAIAHAVELFHHNRLPEHIKTRVLGDLKVLEGIGVAASNNSDVKDQSLLCWNSGTTGSSRIKTWPSRADAPTKPPKDRDGP